MFLSKHSKAASKEEKDERGKIKNFLRRSKKQLAEPLERRRPPTSMSCLLVTLGFELGAGEKKITSHKDHNSVLYNLQMLSQVGKNDHFSPAEGEMFLFNSASQAFSS